jgi:hypothetical protein
MVPVSFILRAAYIILYMDGTPEGMEPCPRQDPLLKPRYSVANEYGWVDPHAVPNCCMPCTSDAGNWDCWVYRNHITNMIKSLKQEIEEKKKEGVEVAPIKVYMIPERYREEIEALSQTG